MKVNSKLELEDSEKKHYVLVGFAEFKKILKKLEEEFKFYRFEYQGKASEKEVIYDVANNLLSDSGVVLSKDCEDGKIKFKVTKISKLQGVLKRPTKEFLLGELETDAEPKDFSLQISTAIENSFSSSFTVDLDSFVRQTYPKIQIDIKSQKYEMIGGTGYRAIILYETAIYKDLKTGKKVSKDGITLKLSSDKESQEENVKVLDIIDRRIKELALYDVSRFEIAQKLLYSDGNSENTLQEEPLDEE